jgi:RNA polymerase sigma factor (sigma-70 family)
MVTRIAGQYWLKEGDVSDLLQETLIALWKSGTATEVNVAWIVRVISNKAVDIVRQARRAGACGQALAQTTAGGMPEPDLEHLLHARVAKLPNRLRDFYRLHYTEGLSEREIASHLGLCRGSVRWLDHCCRNRIIGRRKPSQAP